MSGPRLSTVSLGTGLVLIGVAVYFFLAAVSYMAASQAVVAGLLSAVIGFATLSEALFLRSSACSQSKSESVVEPP